MLKRVVFLLFVIALSSYCPSAVMAQGNSEKAEPVPGLFISITSGLEDPHSVHMGLEVASMGLKKARDVTVFFSVNGPQMASKNLPDSLGKEVDSDEPGIKEMIAGLVKDGATVMVCPHCLKRQGVKVEDLQDGVKVSNPDLLFSKLQPGTVTLTY